MQDEYVSQEHLFLAVLKSGHLAAAKMLERLGITADKFHSPVLIGEPGEEDTIAILSGIKEKCHRVSACFCN